MLSRAGVCRRCCTGCCTAPARDHAQRPIRCCLMRVTRSRGSRLLSRYMSAQVLGLTAGKVAVCGAVAVGFLYLASSFGRPGDIKEVSTRRGSAVSGCVAVRRCCTATKKALRDHPGGPFTCCAAERTRTPNLLIRSGLKIVHGSPPMTSRPAQRPGHADHLLSLSTAVHARC